MFDRCNSQTFALSRVESTKWVSEKGYSNGFTNLRIFHSSFSHKLFTSLGGSTSYLAVDTEVYLKEAILVVYSGTPPNRHPSKVDTHDITDNSESPDCPSIHFNT